MTLIEQIKNKQEFLYVDPAYIEKEIQEYQRVHPKAKEKEVLKQVRAKIRDIYGVYHKNTRKRTQLLEHKEFEQLLNTHLSTRERMPIYQELYKKLETYADLSSILDIACGLNPLSVIYMSKKPKKYIGVDLFEQDAEFLKQAMKVLSIPAQCLAMHVPKDMEQLSKYKTKTCFLFKALDILEKQNKNMTYQLLEYIQAETIIASFTTVNIRQQPLKRVQRNWFEKVCTRLELSFESFILGNELFYVVRKRGTKS